MKKLVENLLRHAQQGDLQALKDFVKEHYPCASSGAPNLEWTSAYHAKSGDTVQIVAARFGHVNILKWLKTEVKVDISQTNFGGKHPLHEAAQYSHVDCALYLLDIGANVDCIKQADWTPLMLACTKHSLEMVQVLVEHKAQLCLKNKDGWTSFHIAVREGNADIVSYLLDCCGKVWDTVSKNGRTPLHTAALHGRVCVTKLLLQRGAYVPDQRDSCGATPLMDAVLNGHREAAEVLITIHGAQLSTENRMGHQAIHQAAQTGNTRAIRYLIEEKGIDVNVRSGSQSHVTPLHMAAKERQIDAMHILLELGADVHSEDSRHRTPLHIAAGVQDARCIAFLLENGAKDTADISGNFAKDLVRTEKLKELFTVRI